MSEPVPEVREIPREYQAKIDALREKAADTGRLFVQLPGNGILFGCTLCGAAVPFAARMMHLKFHVFGTVDAPDPEPAP